ncbi:hypothetical protein UlMin_005123 [Ulmus minor]
MEIVERVMNLESLKEKMNRLKRKMEVLESRECDITEELEFAESLSLKKPKKVVQTWLKHVGSLKNEVQQMDQQVQDRRWNTYLSLPKDVDRLANEATELFQNGNFAGGLTQEAYGSRGVSLLTRNLVGGAFEKNKHHICRWLQSDEGSSVGVYGMGGVGKTTLLTHIHNQLQNLPNTFVSWVTVSQNFSIFELQNRIAKTVGLSLAKDDDERKRAAELARALSGRKKLVLVLDDVWEYIPADKVGIPIGANGFKLILSTRSSKVCERMNCQRTIKVQPLSPEEAWELFLETLVLETSLRPQIEVIARSLVRNCDGLPLGIVTMAGCMKGVDDICEWRNALERMEESKAAQEDMETQVFRVLRYSYDNLKDTTIQQCFLYCSLFPEDWKIGRDELIEYFIDERLIDGRKSTQAKFDTGHTILNKLENVCLLEGGKFPRANRRYVKMHDLIRDMAIEHTSLSPRFLVKAGVGLVDLTEDAMWSEDLVRVSLMHNSLFSLPSNASPRCPRLLTLLLNNCWIERIPDCFFMHMNKLTVLDLSDIEDIKSLPSSISNLRSLTALLLVRCYNLKYVPSLENLTALRRLDISHTGITKVPQGIEMLVNLRYLDLEGTSIKKIPHGILSKLCHLEYLKLFNKRVKVRAEELPRSRKLDTFTGHFYDTVELNTYVSSWEDRGPNSYLLVSGDYDLSDVYDDFERNVYLEGGGNSFVLPKDIKLLEIQDCDEVTCLFDASLENLELCEILRCNGMTHLFCSSSCCRFPLLQKLVLDDLLNLNDLMEGGTSITSTPSNCNFRSLKEFRVSECPNLKRLFMPSLLSHLQNLETLWVRDCYQMEEIIGEASNEDDDQEATRIIVLNNLPKLKHLTLVGLLELKNFCSTGIVRSNSLEEIYVRECPKLRRMPLLCEEPNPLPSLKKIDVEKEWWESLQWDHPQTKDLYQPYCQFPWE